MLNTRLVDCMYKMNIIVCIETRKQQLTFDLFYSSEVFVWLTGVNVAPCFRKFQQMFKTLHIWQVVIYRTKSL